MTEKIPFQVGFITDEVSQSLETAIEFAETFGLSALELRSVDGVSPFDWTEEKVMEMKRLCDEKGMRVMAISAPLFKCNIDDGETVAKHVAAFDRLCGYAKILGAGMIRGFDFWESGASLAARAEQYRPILALCEKYDLLCVAEYDPSVHSSTPEALGELIRFVNHPRLRALYDPGNGIFSAPDRKPYPDGYEALRDLIAHIHIKDAIRNDSQKSAEAVRVGTGWVDYIGLFRRLLADGYKGYVMLETHYRKNAVLSEEQLQRPGGYEFTEGAYEASSESMESLLQMIEQIRKER